MRRRVLALLAALPAISLRAQSSAPRVGFLNTASAATYAFNLQAFRDGLREGGFTEGRNVVIEYRWADGDYSRLPKLAAELAASDVRVIAATGDVASARAAMAATRTIPLVFTVGADPVKFGLVPSMSRPGGNATGITLVTGELAPKRLELLREVVPGVTTVALFMNPDNQNVEADIRAASDAARALRLATVVVRAADPAQFEAAFDEALAKRAGAMLIASDPTFLAQRAKIIELAAKKALPVMYWSREFTDSGGLISFGSGITWMYRAAGLYCAKILKGAPPGDLPILQPTTFQTYINLKTAKALGLTIPQTVLVRADEVIQ